MTLKRYSAVSGALIDYFWTSADTTDAPTTGVFPGQIGAASSGATAGKIYHYNSTTWIDTGSTVVHLYGAQ